MGFVYGQILSAPGLDLGIQFLRKTIIISKETTIVSKETIIENILK